VSLQALGIGRSSFCAIRWSRPAHRRRPTAVARGARKPDEGTAQPAPYDPTGRAPTSSLITESLIDRRSRVTRHCPTVIDHAGPVSDHSPSMTDTVSADADPVSADANTVSADKSADASTVSADAGTVGADAGHLSDLKPERSEVLLRVSRRGRATSSRHDRSMAGKTSQAQAGTRAGISFWR
jgi:hypothetical protein